MALHRPITLVLIVFFGFVSPLAEVDTLTAEEILQAALTRAAKLGDPERDFTFLISEVSEKLDKNGDVTEKETSLLRHIPIGKESFRKVIEKDGRPLSAEEEREEEEREKKLRREISCDESSNDQDDEDKIEFNRELISRYDFEIVGVENLQGRPTHILSFAPKAGDLPVKRRIDRALNNSEGRIWVDAQSFEISRVEFEMNKPLRIWWGMIGSIRSVEGKVERSPVEEDVWLPRKFEFLINGRIFFRGLHLRERVEWRDFERLTADELVVARCD